jgi:hypothetical protein
MANLIKADNGVSSGVTGIVQTADSSGQLALQTTTSGGTATTALVVNNSQQVGINTTSPATYLQVGNNTSSVGGAGTAAWLSLNKPIDSTSGQAGTRMIDFYAYYPGFTNTAPSATINAGVYPAISTQDGFLAFSTLQTNTLTEAARFTYQGNLQFSTSNAGIVFNNSSALANSTLNDYETGTFTPTDQSGAGLSFTVDFATYTKVGRMVTVEFHITYPSTSSGSSAKISIPFQNTSPNTPSNTLSTNTNAQKGITYDTFIYMFALNSTSSATNAQLSGTSIYVQGTYSATF